MELRDYLRILRKHAWLIVAATLLCAAGAHLSPRLATTPVYQGTAKLLVVAKTDPGGGTSSALRGGAALPAARQVVRSDPRVAGHRRGRAAPRPTAVHSPPAAGKVHAEPVTDTLLIDLSVEDADPARAKRLTNNVARAFIASVPKLQSGSALRVSLVEPALTPTEPVRPRTRLNLVLGPAPRPDPRRRARLPARVPGPLGEGLRRSSRRPPGPRSSARSHRSRRPSSRSRSPTSPAPPPPRRSGSCAPTSRSSVSTATASAAWSPPRRPADGKSTVAANLAIALAQSRPAGRARRRRPAQAVPAQALRPAPAGRHHHRAARPRRRPRRPPAARPRASRGAHLGPAPPESVGAARVTAHGRTCSPSCEPPTRWS